jgi:hypothetical protein
VRRARARPLGLQPEGHVKANCAKKKKPDGGADAASDGS